MKYDSNKHHRHSIRLQGYDYTQVGAYYVTMVTHDRECLFGEVVDGEMRLNEIGRVVSQVWQRLPMHFRNIELDGFVIMPNHVHGIVVIVRELTHAGDARRGKALADANASRIADANADALPLHGTPPRSLNAVVQNFKSITARRIHQNLWFADRPIWQRNYYEHVIRNDADLNRIREYIFNNPFDWATDDENPSRKS
jgi:REP element-mobilizing transposase RayT